MRVQDIKSVEDIFRFYKTNWHLCKVPEDLLLQAFEAGMKDQDFPIDTADKDDAHYLDQMYKVGHDVNYLGYEDFLLSLYEEDGGDGYYEDLDPKADNFDQMVEDLELNEDMVECKECFDLFPKVDCLKQAVGYLCPTCQRMHMPRPNFDDVSSRDITVDLYDQEFPDVQDYDPGTTKNWSEEPTVNDALEDLLTDEVEAVDGYVKAAEVVETQEPENAEEILDTIDHIKEEEEEHIEEIKDLMVDDAEAEEPVEVKDEKDDDEKDDDEKEDKSEKLDEASLTDILRNAGSEWSEADLLDHEGVSDLDGFADYETHQEINKDMSSQIRKDLGEKVWVCLFAGEEIGHVLAREHDEALAKMKKKFPDFPYNSPEYEDEYDVYVDDLFEDMVPGDLKEEFFKLTGDEAVDKYNNAIRYAKRDNVPYLYGYTKEDGGVYYPTRPIKIDTDITTFETNLKKEHPEAATLRVAYPTKGFRESYEKAIAAAKASGRSQVFGYRSSLTEEFVAMDPVEVDDIEELEADLALAYEDFGGAEVVDPEDPEILTEANWLANLWTKENKNLDSVFVQGYLVAVAGTETVYEAKSFADAEKIANKASKAYNNSSIYIYGKALPEETYNSYAEPIQKVIAAAGKNTVVAAYKSGKVTLNKAPDINKTIKATKSLLKAVEKGSSDAAAQAALEKEAEELAANLEQPSTGKANVTEPEVAAVVAETEETVETVDNADTTETTDPEGEDDTEAEVEVEVDATTVTTEDYDMADALFKTGFLCFPSKNGKFVELGTSSKAAAESLIKRSKATTENQKKVFYLLAKVPTPDSFEKNGESICKELAGLTKGLKLPKELAGYTNKIYVLASYQNTKRLQAKGQDLLERIKLKAEMFKDLMAEDAEDIESEADVLTTNDADALAEAKSKVISGIQDIVTSWTEDQSTYTEESWSAFETLVTDTKKAVEDATSVKALKPYSSSEKLKKLLGKPLVKKPAEETPTEETSSTETAAEPEAAAETAEVDGSKKGVAQRFKAIVKDIKTKQGRKNANKLIRAALKNAGLANISPEQLTAIRQQLLGEDLEPSVETLLTEAITHLNEDMTLTEEYYTDYTNPAETAAMEAVETEMEKNIKALLDFMSNMGCVINNTDTDSFWSGNDEYTFHVFLETADSDYTEDELPDIQDMLDNKFKELFSTFNLPKELENITVFVNFPDDAIYDEEEDELVSGMAEVCVTFPRNMC
jgi:hypothetical protein